MIDINCEVIEDLLPIYTEDMASPSSRKLVEEHLENCEACKNKLKNMQKEVTLPINTEIDALKRIGNRIRRNKIMAVAMMVCLVLAICVVYVCDLHAPIRLSYEEVKEDIRIHPYADDSGRVEVYLCCPRSKVDISYRIGGDGAKSAQITFYTSKWMMMNDSKDDVQTILPENPKWEDGSYPDKIYYSPQADGMAICLYKAKTFYEKSLFYGYSENLRAGLYLYLRLAGIFTVLGIIAGLFTRKRDTRAYRMVVKFTVIPVMYMISHALILSGKGDIYNPAYYFTGIVLVTILLSLACWWGIMFLYGKNMVYFAKKGKC